MKKILLLQLLFIAVISFGQTNNYSLDFDGDDGYVDFGSHNLYEEYSICMWVQANEDDSFGGLFHHKNPCIRGRGINTTCNYNEYRFGVLNCANPCNVSPCTVPWTTNHIQPTSPWTFVVITFDGISLTKIYLDGLLYNSTDDIGQLLPSDLYPLWIGKTQDDNAAFFNGKIDDLSYWNIALDSIQIQQYMHCPPNGDEPGLIGYWGFEEGAGTMTEDQSINDNDGTLNGGVTWSEDVPPYETLTITAITADETLGGDGSIDVTVTGGNPAYTFDWDNDGTGDFDDTEDLTGLSGGDYTVVINCSAGCNATQTITVNSQLGIHGDQGGNLAIYPNPTSNLVTITLEGLFVYSLVGVNGAVLVTKKSINQAQLDLSEFADGIYFLEIQSENGSETVKLLKQ